MSYSVDLDTLPYNPAMGMHMVQGLGVATFAGGKRGRCVQITVSGGGFVQVDMQQLKELRRVLKHAQKRSLADNEGAT